MLVDGGEGELAGDGREFMVVDKKDCFFFWI